MPNFKDFVQDDLTVFFNPDEFGEIHNIDGNDVLVVIDADTLREKVVNGASMYPTHSGVMLSEFMMFVKVDDIQKPDVGQYITVDGDEYMVTDVTEAAGVYQITLGANQV